MSLGRIFDIATLIVIVGGVTVALSSKNTSTVITAITQGFANSLRAAMSVGG